MGQVSAVIITLNEERNILRCLQSLKGVADEVIVLDTGSTDSTVAICQAERATVFSIKWPGYAAAKNTGNQLAAFPYILSLDADEALSPALTASILKVKPQLSGAYRFNRLTQYCGTWIHHCGWYPDKKIRLFPKTRAKWEGRFVHEKLVVEKGLPITHLKGDLYHYSIYSKGDHLERAHRYAKLSAQKLHEDGKKYSRIKHALSPIARFIRMYIIQGGFLDGKAGLQVCRISARAVRWKYGYLREQYSSPEFGESGNRI